MSLGGCLIAWLFLYDDLHDQGRTADDPAATRRELDQIVKLCRDGVTTDSLGFAAALADIRARGVARVGSEWASRFADSMADYFRGCLAEVPFRHAARAISLAEYRDLRSLTIGTYPVFDLVEVASGLPIASDFASSPEVRATRKLSALLCAWANDLHSFRKERGDEDPMNVVNILQRERKLEVGPALFATADLFNEDLAQLDALIATLDSTPTTGPAERAYLSGLRDWVLGNHAWTPTSGRYYRPDGT